jgi:hypothetical protein
MGRRTEHDVIVDRIPDDSRFGVFVSRPPADHLVLGVCDLHDALGFVAASTHSHPLDTGPIAVLAPDRLAQLVACITGWLVTRRAFRGQSMRYVVNSAGRSGCRAYVYDTRVHRIVLTLAGPDRFAVATAIAAVLNASPTESPVELEP